MVKQMVKLSVGGSKATERNIDLIVWLVIIKIYFFV